jgi:hypothetical protein
MRNFFCILLSAIFLITSIGFTYHVQTCEMMHISKVSLQEMKTCCGSSTMRNDCCKNESHTIKLKDDYTQSLVSFLPTVFSNSIAILTSQKIHSGNKSDLYVVDFFLIHPPPLLPDAGYYILHRNIKI